jgi:hypothetical protein
MAAALPGTDLNSSKGDEAVALSVAASDAPAASPSSRTRPPLERRRSSVTLGTLDTSFTLNSPRFILFIFFSINVLNYFDRGALGICLSTLSRLYGLNGVEEGLLAASYMIGYMIASALFAFFIQKYSPYKLIAVGLTVWCLATAMTGAAQSFTWLLLARICTGAGEGSFLSIAPPMIDRIAPKAQRSQWMAILFATIPIGFALGQALGGVWLDANLTSSVARDNFNWRFLFISESIAMIPFIVYVLVATPPPISFTVKTYEHPEEEIETDPILPRHSHESDSADGAQGGQQNGGDSARSSRSSQPPSAAKPASGDDDSTPASEQWAALKQGLKVVMSNWTRLD